MIFPENFAPLPVADDRPTGGVESSEFVSEQTVRQLLVGPLRVSAPVHRLEPDDGSYAGGGLVESPFVRLAASEEAAEPPAREFRPGDPHPALADPRRARPPVPRHRATGDAGTRRGSGWFFVLGVIVLTLIVASSITVLWHESGLGGEGREAAAATEAVRPAPDSRPEARAAEHPEPSLALSGGGRELP
jgi:hypothetical protein